MTPFPHQLAAIDFFLRTRRCLICHAPGLGKTRTALWAAARHGFNRLVILHPAKVKTQWAANIAEVFPGRVGISQFSWDSQAALKVLPQLRAGDLVCLDESHFLKNANSKRFQTLAPALHQAIVIQNLSAMGLSATPAFSYVQDIFSELFILGLVAWDQRTAFLSRYCRPREGVTGIHFNDTNDAMMPQLKHQLAPFVHVVTWETSGIKMPPITMEEIPCSLDLSVSDEMKYKEAAADFSAWYAAHRGHPAPPLAKFVTLRLMLAQAKVATAFRQLVDELRTPNFKILLFSSFREPLFTLKRMCDSQQIPAFIHTGDESVTEREKAREAFAAHQGSAVLLGTLAATGEAIDRLQLATHRVYFLDVSYSPSEYTQALGRAFRLGQTQPVAVLRFYVPGDELERHIVENIGKKEKFIGELGLLQSGSFFSKT